MCQLVITFGFVALFLLHKPTQQFVARNPALWYIFLFKKKIILYDLNKSLLNIISHILKLMFLYNNLC